MCTGDAIEGAIKNARRKENVNRECIPPHTSSERQMAEYWAHVLGLTKVGVNDNFFQIGGDSLAMVRIILRVHELTDFELPIRAFFDAPTIEEQLLGFPFAMEPPNSRVFVTIIVARYPIRSIVLCPTGLPHPYLLALPSWRRWALWPKVK